MASTAMAQTSNDTTTPLKVRLIPVNYNTADALAPKVKALLSPRGSVTVDDRTNVLIVKDTPEVLAKAELLVRDLDVPMPQVLIEARIVEASKTTMRKLSVQWGSEVDHTSVDGKPTPLVFPHLITVVCEGEPCDADKMPNLTVNMPSRLPPPPSKDGFVFGYVYRYAGDLNLRLAAAEMEGTVRTIGEPKAVTLDNSPASIFHGPSIPFDCPTGRSDRFCDPTLALTITPHVTAEGWILLKVSVVRNRLRDGESTADRPSAIIHREASSNLLVTEGDTIAVGGLYARQGAEEGREVFVFLTSRIIKPAAP